MITKECKEEWFEYSYKMECECGQDTLSFTDHSGSLQDCDYCKRTWSFSLSDRIATLMSDALVSEEEQDGR